MGVGPSTKETSLHHFRDPLLDVVAEDTDLDLLGVIIVGTPQDNVWKERVGQRTAQLLEAMRADGCIISCDGWGNSHAAPHSPVLFTQVTAFCRSRAHV